MGVRSQRAITLMRWGTDGRRCFSINLLTVIDFRQILKMDNSDEGRSDHTKATGNFCLLM
jgi:hypothetical protein